MSILTVIALVTGNFVASTAGENFQECSGSSMKHSFPDVDYAFLGYNILKGYPLSNGHDPGFTYPIFIANYTSGLQSADCRYSIPNGMTMIPDVSCTTSFSSTVIQTAYEFSNYLSVSVGFSVGSWFGSFSASAGYKSSFSSVSSGEYVLIVSSADCKYYFSKLNLYSPPQLHPDFKDWIYKLNRSNERSTYMKFFEYYGTHFPLEVVFGARYVNQHKMKTEMYKAELARSVNLAVSASYSGWFSVSSRYSMHSSKKEKTSSFKSKVTTNTITTGAAPPANGDAMTWASSVKENPVPVKYKLNSIDKLFNSRYMKEMNVNYNKIAKNIKLFSSQYCSELQQQGLVDVCNYPSGELTSESTKFIGRSRVFKTVLLAECIAECLSKIDCAAISFCKTCNENACHLFSRSSTLIYSSLNEGWSSIILRPKINVALKVHKTAINGISRGERGKRVGSQSECAMKCYDDNHCVAFTYCYCPDRVSNCQLFGETRINYLYEKEGMSSYIMSTFIRNTTRQSAENAFNRLINEIPLKSTKLEIPTKTVKSNDFQTCLNFCLRKLNCTAISFCKTCRSQCGLFIGTEPDCKASTDTKYESLILRSNIAGQLEFEHSEIYGGQQPDSVAEVASKTDCASKCYQSSECMAFSYSTCTDENNPFQCNLYSEDHILKIERKLGSVAVIFSNKSRPVYIDNKDVGFNMDNSQLKSKSVRITTRDYRTCKKECMKREKCFAITFSGRNCYIITEDATGIGYPKKGSSTAFVRSRIHRTYEIKDTELEGYCTLRESTTTRTSSECLQKCLNQEACAAISFSLCSQEESNCKLFQENEIRTFKKKDRTKTLILSKTKHPYHTIVGKPDTPTSPSLIATLKKHMSKKIILRSTLLQSSNLNDRQNSLDLCEHACNQKRECIAVSYSQRYRQCHYFYGNRIEKGVNNRWFTTTVFPERISSIQLDKTEINTGCASRNPINIIGDTNVLSCLDLCRSVIGCVAISYQNSECQMFEQDAIKSLGTNTYSKTFFVGTKEQ